MGTTNFSRIFLGFLGCFLVFAYFLYVLYLRRVFVHYAVHRLAYVFRSVLRGLGTIFFGGGVFFPNVLIVVAFCGNDGNFGVYFFRLQYSRFYSFLQHVALRVIRSLLGYVNGFLSSLEVFFRMTYFYAMKYV